MHTADRDWRIGILSDTHGLLRPEVIQALQGVDQILHAGDVGSIDLLDSLRLIAPVTAIRGNVDLTGNIALLPATEIVRLGDSRLTAYLVHSVHDLDIDPAAAGVALVISGHSHAPLHVRTERGRLPEPGQRGSTAVQAAHKHGLRDGSRESTLGQASGPSDLALRAVTVRPQPLPVSPCVPLPSTTDPSSAASRLSTSLN